MDGYYPWQPDDVEQGREGARVLWVFTRNPLSHTLGVGKDMTTFPETPGEERPVVLSKSRDRLPDGEVVERVLGASERPDWVRPTIGRYGSGYDVSVEALAWGTNRMLRALFADDDQATAAEETARRLLIGE